MEEIDKIIVDSLKNLKCSLDDEITSIKQFDVDTVVSSIATCLEAINPELHLSKKLPPSMSAKLKITTTLAQHVKDMGFRDEVGYQTILYCNEAEVRRILMFLIERLPRESHKIIEDTGYVSKLVKEIEAKVKQSLEQLWVPSSVLERGCRAINETQFLLCSTGDSTDLHTRKLQIPRLASNDSEKQYWIHNVPEVTKQCPQEELIPSLLFPTSTAAFELYKFPLKHEEELIPSDFIQNSTIINAGIRENTTPKVDLVADLIKELSTLREDCVKLQAVVKTSELQLKQMGEVRQNEVETLKKSEALVDVKTKTLKVLSKEENLSKLKNMIESTNNKLLSMAEQWKQIQTPLLEEYKSLQSQLSSEDRKKQEHSSKVDKLEHTLAQLRVDLETKSKLERDLREQSQKLASNNNRSGYTRRILEIVGNIQKQDAEIRKILKDTEQVQKEIKTLTGQVDRSFTLSDELIFRDAPHDETARKSYKLLAQLRDECSNIIAHVKDVGVVERESRNLQEQIEAEIGKEYGIKLEKVTKDLIEIRKENELLIKQAN